ncbi:MAG: hypothetical protein A3F09_00200 [Chlamydiae bacterium RIFCSPHIGHO2_12_FULL_49_11]|nr:MAG: hypothetical protein A3F09_00200 [Chlamydiae bacterium RIFCSPHIGHO2_12_FULL_49_11]
MESSNLSEKAIVRINTWAQVHLLRQGERWEEQVDRFEALRQSIQPLLQNLGFIDAAFPHFSEYRGAIVHGGLLSRVRLRLHYLVKLWENGLKFEYLYFLSGQRPLEREQEGVASLVSGEGSPLKMRIDFPLPKQFPTTECEMTQFVWAQSEIPQTMRQEVEVHFIDAPMKTGSSSTTLLRPTTDDTVKYWLQENPPYGRYLAITNAPYMNRQDLVIRTLAPKGYGFDTVGSGANEQEKIAIIIDELARSIFQMDRLSCLQQN